MIVKGRQVVRVLTGQGWTMAGIRDRSEVLVHADYPDVSLVVPVHGNPLKPAVLERILEQAGMTPAEFAELV